MHRTLRMLGILIDLQNGPSTLGKLAANYECSSKTIQRDVTALTELNIPVFSSPGVNGGISLDPGWMLGQLNFTAAEIETLILALESSPHLPAVETTLAKIRAASTPSRFDAVAESPLLPNSFRNPAGKLPKALEQVRNMIRRNLWCRIDYDGGSKPGWRIVKPVELRISEGRWYLHAIDERSREQRFFRIDRVRDVIPTLAPANAEEIEKHAKVQPEYRSSQHPLVIVNLGPAGKRFCQDHTDFHEFINGDGDQLQFRCPPREYRYYAGELLRIGTDCTVLAPPELINEMQKIVKNIRKHLSLNQDDMVS